MSTLESTSLQAPLGTWPRLALGGWFALTSVGAAYLLGAHVAGLPLPSTDDPRLVAAIAARHREGRPLALHVLYADCECSNRVLARLEARMPRADVDEAIVLVVPAAAESRRTALAEREGFAVEQVTAESLPEAFGLAVAPVLVVADARGALAYLGGYSERKQSAELETERLLDEVVAGRRPEPLPVLGCAVTAELRGAVDPWRLR